MNIVKELKNYMIYKLKHELNCREFNIHVIEYENDYMITIYPQWDWNNLTVSMLKKWVKESGIPFSKLKGTKRKGECFNRDHLRLHVYKKFD